MASYKETKSRHSVTKDFSGQVQVKTQVPKNTCHPGQNVEFHSLAKPPVWKCAKCGTVIRTETTVNEASITEY